MRIDAFRPAAEFKKHMDNWIDRFRNAKTAKGFESVLIPGDPERTMERQRMQEGIPVVPAVVQDLQTLADKLHIPFPV
jgi:LDH2 family malate/lactate/ureidoglycolate dehydrogenase